MWLCADLGGTPSQWLAEPLGYVLGLAAELPRLRARRRLERITDGALSAGSMDAETRQRILDPLLALSREEQPPAAAPDRAPSPELLEAMGVPIRRVPR